VGANLARRLLVDGHETVLLGRPGCDRWRLADIERDARLLEVDLTDDLAVREAMASIKPDWVFHLAAHGAYSWQRDLGRMIAVNLSGTANLLRASIESGCKAFINTGSSSEYGSKDHAPSEDEAVAPNSDYAVTKLAATLHCQQVARAEGVKVTTLRLYSVYGPFEEPHRLVPALAVRGLEGRLPSLADPRTARDYVWVGDVVDAFLAAASIETAQPGAVYNVGTGRQTTLRDAVATARKVLDLAAQPDWGAYPSRRWDTAVWVADSTRIAAELGWRAAIDFETGFRATVDWLRDNPSLVDLYRMRIEAH
jgi:nucleoside-diphosphate-sugar epimerase